MKFNVLTYIGEALHPLIHIGFAMEFGDQHVLTEGLSYACTYPLKGALKMDLDSKLDSQSNPKHSPTGMLPHTKNAQRDNINSVEMNVLLSHA